MSSTNQQRDCLALQTLSEEKESLNIMRSEVHGVDTTADTIHAAMFDEYKDLFHCNLGNLPVFYKLGPDANVHVHTHIQ